MAITTLGANAIGTLSGPNLPTGSVLQTLQANKTDKQLIESTSFVDILSQAITPSATSSGILIMAYVTSGGNGHWDFKVTRTVSGGSEANIDNASGTGANSEYRRQANWIETSDGGATYGSGPYDNSQWGLYKWSGASGSCPKKTNGQPQGSVNGKVTAVTPNGEVFCLGYDGQIKANASVIYRVRQRDWHSDCRPQWCHRCVSRYATGFN